jgi:rhomboid protease GluP
MQTGPPEAMTVALLALMAAVFAVECWLPIAGDNWLVTWAGSGPAALRLGAWWRLFTAIFIHANLLHLAMNGVGLWIFGSAVERSGGRWRLLTVFLLGGAAGNLLSAGMHQHELSVGASGGVFALLGAFGVAVGRVRLPIYTGLRRRLLVLLAVMVAADLTIGWLEPQVDNLAHLGGLVAGVVLGLF